LYGAAGAAQHHRLADAARLDWEAAHKACSWGAFQILGLHHEKCGYQDIKGFVEAMHKGPGAHLHAFVALVKASRLDGALRSAIGRHLRAVTTALDIAKTAMTTS
jgi:hypothetical protein